MPPKKVKNKYGFMVEVSHLSYPHSPPSDTSITTPPKRRTPQSATEPVARPTKQSKRSSGTVSQAPSPARIYDAMNQLGTALDKARHPSSLAIREGDVAANEDAPQHTEAGQARGDAEAHYLFTCKAPYSISFDETDIKEETHELLLRELRLYRAGGINFERESTSVSSPSPNVTVSPLKSPKAETLDSLSDQPFDVASDPKSTAASSLPSPGVNPFQVPELASTAHFAAPRLGRQRRTKIPARSNLSVAKFPANPDTPQ
ncbi:hypothetical protein N0V94_002143 [Neodidymelliopsis sp. IMI 364377]|nr:hypothetical protein N0V94_002143 [Neodidymelliopsis sp. IMI 364377]